MKVGDLYIQIGVKGANEATLSLNSVKKTLNDITSAALSAFAEVAGLTAAFAAMAKFSGDAGMQLKQFSNLTNISTDTLQRWQYMMQQSGVGAADTADMFKKVQESMAKINLLEEPPKWLMDIGAQVGIDPKRFQDTIYMMEKFRQYALTSKDSVATKQAKLSETGLFSTPDIQALMTNKFDLSKAPKWFLKSDKEIDGLSKTEVAWTNFYSRLGRIRDKFVEQNSDAILKDLQKFVKILEKDVLPTLEPAFKKLTKVVGEFFGYLEKHPESVKTLTELGAALLVLSKALTVIAAINPAVLIGLGIFSMESKRAEFLKSDFMKDHLAKQASKGLGSAPLNLTQNITAPSPHKAAELSAKGVMDAHSQSKEYQKAHRSNPRINEVN